MREFVVLGTASQVPTRTRNGYQLRWDGEDFLVDPGVCTQGQMLHAGVCMAVPIRPSTPVSDEDKLLWAHARELLEMRPGAGQPPPEHLLEAKYLAL